MSYDFDTTAEPCDHEQALERYIVSPTDFRTLLLASNPAIRMRAPINGQSLVQMFISGQYVAQDDPVFGYTFVADDNPNLVGFTGYVFFKMVFNHPVRFITPLIEVTYLTTVAYCLKCSGTSQLDDFKRASSGAFLIIVDTRKLVQRSLKYILTSRCPFYPLLACPLRTYIGKKIAQASVADVSNAVMTALANFKKVQSAQATVQTLTPLETLKDITNVSALPVKGDPTAVSVLAQVSSYGTTATVPIGFTINSNTLTAGQ
jgi:hypothetical protein